LIEEYLVRLSSRTQIPLKRFREVLGLEKKVTCRAKTIAEARSMYVEAERSSNEEISAYNRWNTLSTLEVRRAKTFVDAREAHNGSPDESTARKLAFKKCLLLATSAAEAKLITLPYVDSADFQYGVERWINLSVTLEELLEAHKHASVPNQRKAILKMVSIFRTS